MIVFLVAFISLFFLELLYFKIADQYNIIDKPNQRSSHTQTTLRGGGIIFPIATIVGILLYQPQQWSLALATFFIATVSFLDDIITLSNKFRIAVHFTSVLLVLFQVFPNVLQEHFIAVLFLLIVFVVVIGIINAYNFMDGINGITVLYSSVAVASIFYVQNYLQVFILEDNIFIFILSSLLVFGFFNVRKKAKAFAGDVGSISIALIISYLIIQLIITTEDLKWILLLGVYGIDSVATIVCRIFRRENIFEAHRSHFYQYLANEKKWNHILISSLYAFFQLILNIIVIYTSGIIPYMAFLFVLLGYVFLRLRNEGKNKLFGQY